MLINSQYTIENNGCGLSKLQVISEHLLCCLLLYTDEQKEIHSPSEQDSCIENSNIFWLLK